jgi:hypothetical protein
MGNPVTAVRDSTGLVAFIDATEFEAGRWALETHDAATTSLLTPASSASTSLVTLLTTNTSLLASNSARKGATIQNTSALAIAHLTLGATSTLTTFTVHLIPNAYYELPYGYTGPVSAIGDVAGAVTVTELT